MNKAFSVITQSLNEQINGLKSKPEEDDSSKKRNELKMKYGKKDMLFYDILTASLEGICELDQESIMSSYSNQQIQ